VNRALGPPQRVLAGTEMQSQHECGNEVGDQINTIIVIDYLKDHHVRVS
jgi:hypothetical protein